MPEEQTIQISEAQAAIVLKLIQAIREQTKKLPANPQNLTATSAPGVGIFQLISLENRLKEVMEKPNE